MFPDSLHLGGIKFMFTSYYVSGVECHNRHVLKLEFLGPQPASFHLIIGWFLAEI